MSVSLLDDAAERRIMAVFHPRAWRNDYAIDVDPEGPVEFDVTAEIEAMGEAAARRLKDDRDNSDDLSRAAGAPDWIRNWSGPF